MEYEEALAQWAPKVQGITSRAHVPYMEPEDLGQELNMVLLKCLRAYDEGNGASFHTFFHRACWNRIFTLTRDVNRHRGSGSENNVIYLDGDPLEGLSQEGPVLPYNRRLLEAFSVGFGPSVGLVLELQGFTGLEITYVRGRMDLLSIAETAVAYEVSESGLREVARSVRSKVARLRAG